MICQETAWVARLRRAGRRGNPKKKVSVDMSAKAKEWSLEAKLLERVRRLKELKAREGWRQGANPWVRPVQLLRKRGIRVNRGGAKVQRPRILSRNASIDAPVSAPRDPGEEVGLGLSIAVTVRAPRGVGGLQVTQDCGDFS